MKKFLPLFILLGAYFVLKKSSASNHAAHSATAVESSRTIYTNAGI